MLSWIYVHQCWCVLVGWKRAWKKSWSYRQLWSTTWMMGTEPWSPIKSNNVLNHWAIFTAPISLPFNSSGYNPEEWYCPQWVSSSQLNSGGHDSHRQVHRTALPRQCFIEVLFLGDRWGWPSPDPSWRLRHHHRLYRSLSHQSHTSLSTSR